MANRYGELIPRWKVGLIGRRARRLGFREDEIPDLEQRIVLQLLAAEFREGGSASEATFVTRVIDFQLLKVLRDRRRDLRRANYAAVSYEGLTEPPCFGTSEVERVELRLDLYPVPPGGAVPKVERLDGLTVRVTAGNEVDVVSFDGRTRRRADVIRQAILVA